MIERKSLKSQIIDAIWELILKEEIKPNDPLREIHLAGILNISRTPLRDALQQLEWEGIVTSQPGRGYRLSEFSEQEIHEIYPLRAKLESFALELSGIPSKQTMAELVSINSKMLHSNSPKKLIELDEIWHNLLISNCANRKLMKMIKILQRQSQRYEYAYMNIKKEVEVSVIQHQKIIESLEKRDLKEASKLFSENIMVGIEMLAKWIKSNNY